MTGENDLWINRDISHQLLGPSPPSSRSYWIAPWIKGDKSVPHFMLRRLWSTSAKGRWSLGGFSKKTFACDTWPVHFQS